ncbi:MAG TPA: NADH-quinone oxidoreductase subunit N [Microthrixaceae bacterium]|nr:NADH-quinone oxidoreductase subunit N [Microthrixaceae bacterium]
MIASLFAQAGWSAPVLDWHALAPELIVTGTVCALLLIDVIMLERAKPVISAVASLGFLAALVPLVTLALHDDSTREMFGGAYVTDEAALLLKALFLVSGYIVVLLATNYVAEGDYWESEFYTLIASSLLGMLVMASARDLISIFLALELLSIPAYMLAAWRKRDPKSNEAGLKYYLMGVFASAVLLYGMSLVYGVAGSTKLVDIGVALEESGNASVITLAVIFVLIGFAFKVSAVPFHTWAPDTYEGAPTPVTAFLAVASKTAGFVALINVVFFAFLGQGDVVRPVLWVLSALSMTVGNLIALRQTNVVRMLAYSGIAQAGFILAPFAVAGQSETALSTIIVYLVIYGAMNLGAFTVVIAVARKTRSAEIDSYNGLFSYAPGLTVAMTIFLASLIGIPPFAGWYAKFGVVKSLVEADTGWGYSLVAIVAVNTAIAAAYYLRIARAMWFEEEPNGDLSPVRVPPSLVSSLAICLLATVVFGVLPQLLTEAASITTALGR